jgi:hypothetical protein
MDFVLAPFRNECIQTPRPKPITPMFLLMASTLAMMGCHWQPLKESWNSSRIPAYEPLMTDISGFPSASAKAKFVQIAADMRERLIYHHVDAPHANAMLWQFHFFAPVKYLNDDCRTYINLHHQRFKNENEQIKRMTDAAKDVFDRFDQSIPYSPLALGAFDNAHRNINQKVPFLFFDEFWASNRPGINAYSPSRFTKPEYVLPTPEEERYLQESIKIGDELRNNIHRHIPISMTNYHIRNFLIDLHLMGINATGQNTGILPIYKKESSERARNYFLNIEYLYEISSGKSSCAK